MKHLTSTEAPAPLKRWQTRYVWTGTVSCSYLRSRLSWCFPWTFESETILQRSCGLREQTFGVRAKGATSSHPLLAGTPRVSGGLGVPAKNHLQPDSMRKMSRKTAAVRLQGGPTQSMADAATLMVCFLHDGGLDGVIAHLQLHHDIKPELTPLCLLFP
ncbi:uncharacterized protein LOC120796034 isoform X4 [Xiphias gladius]|uniref:uncharacterized protein LOC120796034 isoform X4 n=1 Tax=Xiphias gladius TaxID=8245 RepID=UPI001A99255D|nr:uncharacterized protein LOC120796034 isoform X4 [Xiphias gladius]